jgi:uncharacterized protein YjiS (DUF1127 family)
MFMERNSPTSERPYLSVRNAKRCLSMNASSFKLPEMQSDHSAWWPGRRKSWLIRAAAHVKARSDLMKERRRVFGEREAMSDRELADLGIARHEIPRVFDAKFAEERSYRVR